MSKKIVIYCDGASKGNPGQAAIGGVLKDDKGSTLEKISKRIGVKTNNEAEYTAVITSLEKARALGAEEISLYTDSELVAKQIKGLYRVKKESLKPYYNKVISLIRQLKSFKVTHVTRDKNAEADRLANEAYR